MSDEEWKFGEPWPSYELRSVGFLATRGKDHYKCAITVEAIYSACRTQGTIDEAFEKYKANPTPWHDAGIRLIENGRIHPSGYYLIRSNEVREFGILT